MVPLSCVTKVAAALTLPAGMVNPVAVRKVMVEASAVITADVISAKSMEILSMYLKWPDANVSYFTFDFQNQGLKNTQPKYWYRGQPRSSAYPAGLAVGQC